MKLNPAIFIAIAVGLSMTAGSFFLAKTKETPTNPIFKNNSDETKPLRTFIPITDSDQNNIPDWQETFTSVEVSLGDSSTTSPTMVGNLTSELAARTAAGINDPEAIVDELDKKLTLEITEEKYTRDDITVTENNSTIALRTYGNAVAVIAQSGTLPEGTDTPLNILDSYFLHKDPSILEKLVPHEEAYSKMVKQMLVTPVPSSMTNEHLYLINIYSALSADIAAMQKAETDALAAMLRMRRYPQDANALYTAVSDLYLKIHRSGVQWNNNDAASSFIKIE